MTFSTNYILSYVPPVIDCNFLSHSFTHFSVLKKFLRFATGSEELPAIGYGTGQLTVNISSQLNGVCASTCTLTIHVPVFKEYEQLSTALNCVIAEDVFNTV